MAMFRRILYSFYLMFCCASLYGQNINIFKENSNPYLVSNLKSSDGIETNFYRNPVNHNVRKKINIDWSSIEEKITPILGVKWGGMINNGDSLLVGSIEIGAGLILGSIDELGYWGWIPTGWIWNYLTLPYVSFEYRWFNRYYEYQGNISENLTLSPIVMNVGVSGGTGFVLTFLPVPIGINGMAGLSTDFQQLFLRGRIGWDFIGGSIGFTSYYSLTRKATSVNRPHYTCLELSFTLIRDNGY